MNRYFAALAPLALLTASGCAAPFQAQVSRFQQLPAPQGQSFVVVADDPRLAGGLEFSQYARIVEDRLASYGYTRAVDPASANLVVHFDYEVDGGRERVRRVPGGGFGYGFGHRPLGFGYGWGGYRPFYGYGRRHFIYGWDDPFLYGSSFYDEVESYTVYESRLSLRIDRRGGGSVFEGTAQARSTDNDLTTLVPNLVEALFTGFPSNTGKTVRITLAPPERQRR